MATDPEAAYFQSVEEYFVSRRGDPMFLSDADWTLVRRWREQGIPLRIVLRGIRDALDAHAHSWNRARKVMSLAYCKAEVEAAAATSPDSGALLICLGVRFCSQAFGKLCKAFDFEGYFQPRSIL